MNAYTNSPNNLTFKFLLLRKRKKDTKPQKNDTKPQKNDTKREEKITKNLVTELHLTRLQLSGTLSGCIFELHMLHKTSLCSNSFNDTIPSSLSKCMLMCLDSDGDRKPHRPSDSWHRAKPHLWQHPWRTPPQPQSPQHLVKHFLWRDSELHCKPLSVLVDKPFLQPVL